jgi:alkylation response protein AidB-like acyl-CoA dehydrogenase
MALNPLVDTRDVKFVIFELLEMDQLCKYPKFQDFDKDTFESTLDLAEKMCIEQLYPSNALGDKEGGCTYDPATKKVTIPPCYKPVLDAFYEAGFYGLSDDPEHGGTGMPVTMNAVGTEYICASNYPLGMYPGLSHGAMELISAFGTEEQKHAYMPKMMTGEWGGTMCLTEPEAGSDVGNLKTKAVKQPDGTYKITGTKIFISSGENDYYKNMIHPVLARIEGDPPGTKGISIFIVPKFLINKDGSLGASNDVVCAGIEHKMGIKGSATSQLSFGDEGKCIGYLLGQERQGMKIMFKMMNYARMGVALQGHGNSSAAYMHAITYAKNRKQGAHVTQMLNPEAPLVSIINHPDIVRTLLWMKAHLEGQRILCYYMFYNIDLTKVMQGEDAKEANGLVEILTPICKAGCTDKGVDICSEAVQIYGGYGYCSDYPVEKYMRDAKILTIWEGTNGIQSMDLTFRKILMNENQYNYNAWKKRVKNTVDKAKGIVDDKYIALIEKGIVKLDEAIEMMKQQIATQKFMHLFMNATPLQQAMYMMAMAWAHLWSLTITLPKLKAIAGDLKGAERNKLLQENQEAAFYQGKVLASQFYIGVEMPKYFGKIDSLLGGEAAVIKATPDIFTGALAE